jgi:hypothetical protein
MGTYASSIVSVDLESLHRLIRFEDLRISPTLPGPPLPAVFRLKLVGSFGCAGPSGVLQSIGIPIP